MNSMMRAVTDNQHKRLISSIAYLETRDDVTTDEMRKRWRTLARVGVTVADRLMREVERLRGETEELSRLQGCCDYCGSVLSPDTTDRPLKPNDDTYLRKLLHKACHLIETAEVFGEDAGDSWREEASELLVQIYALKI